MKNKHKIKLERERRRKAAIKYLGGKSVITGQSAEEIFNRYLTNSHLHFHHIRPKRLGGNKKFNISEKFDKPMSLDLLDEIDKCVLLESNYNTIIERQAIHGEIVFKDTHINIGSALIDLEKKKFHLFSDGPPVDRFMIKSEFLETVEIIDTATFQCRFPDLAHFDPQKGCLRVIRCKDGKVILKASPSTLEGHNGNLYISAHTPFPVMFTTADGVQTILRRGFILTGDWEFIEGQGVNIDILWKDRDS
jgi:hypothetical protein